MVLARSRDVDINVFQLTVMQYLGCERVILLGFPPVVYHLQIGADIYAVLTADGVTTAEVSY